MSVTIPPIISADDHLIEPPDVWQTRLPRRFREVGPRVEMLPTGTVTIHDGRYTEAPGTSGKLVPWWRYEDSFYSIKKYVASAGLEADAMDMGPITFDEMRPGCWRAKDRIKDMDVNGVEASLCFPNYPRFCGQLFLDAKDRELALLCIKAFNDWMVEEWCGESNGRLIPLCIVPLWDPELAAQEVRRNADRGVRAVTFSELPTWLGLPSLHSGYWDTFLAACEETQTVVCMHIGSGTRTFMTSDDAPMAVATVMVFANSAGSMLDFLTSGILGRFPSLKVLYAECEIGWIPYVLQQADQVWIKHKWSHHTSIAGLPSDFYRGRVFSCFFKDPLGIELLDRIGTDQVLFETDYPHIDTTWPNSRAAASTIMANLEADVVHKLCRGNAMRLFGLSS
jgi:predicted TIM-barrel fold metal-dependent hydrolase